MTRRLPVLLAGAVAAIGAALFVAVRLSPAAEEPITPGVPATTTDASSAASAAADPESAGLCPWRQPKEDMRRFFPGADREEQRLLILSDLRLEVTQRLGPGGLMDANGIYCYRVFRGAAMVGSILTQRTAGEDGAIEYVLAMAPDGRIRGVRLQRQRERGPVTAAVGSPAWLGAFAGKTARSPFRVGSDLPGVPAVANASAASLADSIRRLVIEFEVAREHGR